MSFVNNTYVFARDRSPADFSAPWLCAVSRHRRKKRSPQSEDSEQKFGNRCSVNSIYAQVKTVKPVKKDKRPSKCGGRCRLFAVWPVDKPVDNVDNFCGDKMFIVNINKLC